MDLAVSLRLLGFGPASLFFGEMDAGHKVTGNPLAPWQAEVLLAMDAAFLAAQARRERRGREGKG